MAPRRPHDVCEMYQIVLCEAYNPHDLTCYINGATLITTWPEMFLPKGVRRAWEECHAVLRGSPAR